MAVATSPYQQNDYQAASTFRPYNLPVDSIIRSNMAINSFWDQGARRVKNVYENALGLNLVTGENKAIRDNFIKEAEKQITKLSSMNLSDPSVQRQGIGIFQPLLQDENIIGEDYVVKNLSKEINTAQSFKYKDNGKAYNPLSLENLQYEKNLLNSSLNRRDGWKALYNNMSTYQPQVDTSAEIKKIQDTVKAEEIKEAKLRGDEWYIETIDKKGVSKERLQEAIETMGSSALKAQMRVEGRNAYYKHLSSSPETVDSYFQSLASRLFDRKIQDLKSNKADIDYQNYMTPDKPDNAERKTLLTSNSKRVQDAITDLQNNQKPNYVSEFRNLHDVNNLSANLSKIEQLWQSSSVHEMSENLAYQNTIEDLKANPVKIAKENNRIATERISLGYANLGEERRHNTVTEGQKNTELLLKAQENELKAKENDGSTNPVFGGTGGSGIFPGTTPATTNQADIDAANAKAREDFVNKNDEPLRQTTISTILGPDAWASIQQNVESNSLTGAALTDEELNKAAKFFKAFGDKYKDAKVMGFNLFPTGDESKIKDGLSKINVSTFKQIMGEMVKHDVEFTGDLILKTEGTEGIKKAAEFRNAVNNITRKEMNLTQGVYNKLPAALGEYAKYFNNAGRTPLTDDAISSAYERYKNDSSKPISIITINGNTKSESFGQMQSSREATAQEIAQYKKGTLSLPYGQHAVNSIKSKESFAQDIRKATDPIFGSLLAENNVNQTSHSFAKDKNAFSDFQAMKSMIANSGSEAHSNTANILSFVENHLKDAGFTISTPSGEETVPSIKFSLTNLSDKEAEIWSGLQDHKLPIATANKQWYQKGSGSADFRFRGAVLTAIPVNNTDGKGLIHITNTSPTADRISPSIQVENVYVRDEKGKKLDITPAVIEQELRNRYGGLPLSEILDKYTEDANVYLSAYITNIEKRNREFENKSKK